jgi:hypothetical protein
VAVSRIHCNYGPKNGDLGLIVRAVKFCVRRRTVARALLDWIFVAGIVHAFLPLIFFLVTRP